MDQPVLISAVLLTGCLAGFLGGLLGIGGGVVLVPALILLLDALTPLPVVLVTVIAVATSLCCVLGTSAIAGYAQLRAKKVRWGIVRRWTIPLMAGAVLSGSVAVALPERSLRILIGLFLASVAAIMLTRWQPKPERSEPGVAKAGLLGALCGLVSGLAGIGGGNLIVPTLLYHNTPMHEATATSSALGVPVALAGLSGYLWLSTDPLNGYSLPGLVGYLYLPAAVLLLLGAVALAPIGVRVAHRLNPQPLRQAFGLLLLLVSGRMLYSGLAS